MTTLFQFTPYNITNVVILRYSFKGANKLMMTFFTILFVLIILNAIMMLFSLKNINQKPKSIQGEFSDNSDAKIYPIDLANPKYKKAV
ncbi:hypothetical protein [Maribacter sp.]|uniref:hypothetical protein n=1 Tax=Maribacter sp. TaxID=1897614 RepID=UPI0025C2DA94|nr:hypothetical protein [Maribacter sp.]